MQFKHPVTFYRSIAFWFGLIFVWVAIFGFPKTMVTVGDIFTYPIIFIIAVASILSAIFQKKKKY